jgi:hypothetical protein
MPLIVLCGFFNSNVWPLAERIVTRRVLGAYGPSTRVFAASVLLQYNASGLSEASPMTWP